MYSRFNQAEPVIDKPTATELVPSLTRKPTDELRGASKKRGHSSLVDKEGNTIISIGPDKPGYYSDKELASGVGGTNDWNTYNAAKYEGVTKKIVLKDVNMD